MHQPDSPTRGNSSHPADFGTPTRQHIPAPVPPAAPRRPRDLSHWRSRPRDDSLILRNYFLNLPTASLFEGLGGPCQPTTLQEYFEQTQQLAKEREEQYKGASFAKGQQQELNFMPQLAANVTAHPARDLRIRTRTSRQLTCFSCGSADCGTMDLLGSPMARDQTSTSAPLPPFRVFPDDSDDEMSPGTGKRRPAAAATETAAKRSRPTSQTQLPPAFFKFDKLGPVDDAPLPPSTPCLASQALSGQAIEPKGQSLRIRSFS